MQIRNCYTEHIRTFIHMNSHHLPSVLVLMQPDYIDDCYNMSSFVALHELADAGVACTTFARFDKYLSNKQAFLSEDCRSIVSRASKRI